MNRDASSALHPRLSHSAIAELLTLQKRPAPFGPWIEQQKSGELRIEVALLHAGATVAGLSLRLSCHRERPLERIAIQLEVEAAGKPRPMARVDWNGSVHGNTSPLAGPFQSISAGRTHFHDPCLHDPERDPMDYLRDNLPVAAPIDAPCDSWMTVLEISGTLLNIDDLTLCPEPEWQPRL